MQRRYFTNRHNNDLSRILNPTQLELFEKSTGLSTNALYLIVAAAVVGFVIGVLVAL